MWNLPETASSQFDRFPEQCTFKVLDQPISQIHQFYPANGLGTYTIELFNDKVKTEWKNMFGKYERSIALKEIKPEYEKSRQSFDSWDHLVWLFLLIFIILSFFKFRPFTVAWMAEFLPLLIALFFFSLKFKKYDRANFIDKQNNFLFAVRISTKSGIEKAFLDRLV